MAHLFVGNLSFHLTDDQLAAAFAPFGQVASARVIRNPETGRACGFGLVDMPDSAEAEKAVAGLHQQLVDERPIRVACARPREDGPRR